MVWGIAKKEFLLNVMTFKFAVGTTLCVVLMAVFMPVLVNDYQQRLKDYNTNVSATQAVLQKAKVYDTLLLGWNHFVYRPPTIFSTFSKDIAHQVGDSVVIGYFRVPELSAGSKEVNPYLSILPTLDISLIFKIIISVLALLVACDVISNEREQGTLKLMLSAGVARYQILLGKLLAGLMTLFIPVTIAFITGLLIWQFSPMIDLTGSDWARIAMLYFASLIFISVMYHFGLVALHAGDWLKMFVIILLSILYLSIFVLLGIFISSRMAYPTNSMVVLLLIWVGLVILLPCLGRAVSDVFYKAPSNAVWSRRYSEMLEQLDRDATAGKFGENALGYNSDPNHPSVNPPAAARYWNAFTAGVMQQREDGHNQRVAQALAGRRYARLSPLVIYQQASEAIAGTGIHRCRNIWEQIIRYRHQLKDYILSQDTEDPGSLHLLFGIGELVKGWNAISKKPVDFDTVPKFQEKDWALGESLRLAVWDIGLLALFNLALFAASWASFMKYDVR